MSRFFFYGLTILTVFFTLVPHLVWGVSKLVGRLTGHSVPYAPFGWTSFGLVALAWGMMAYGYYLGRWRLQVTEVAVTHATVPAAFDGYRIVHISDLHLSSFSGGHDDRLRRIVETINAWQPDLICFTGDLVSLVPDEAYPLLPLLRELRAKDGIASVLGNHDFFLYTPQHRTARAQEEALQQLCAIERDSLGWRLLRNDGFVIHRENDSIAVAGVDNSSCQGQGFRTIYRGDLSRALQAAAAPFKVLLTHDPGHWRAEVLGKTDVALTLSGHTHAAQIRLFGWTPASWMFSETDGLYREGEQLLYVNIGIGCTAPVRLGAVPEITVITLRSQP